MVTNIKKHGDGLLDNLHCSSRKKEAEVMGQQVSVDTSSSIRVEWMWQSNSDPWDKSELPEWTRYPDVENRLIEEAFTNKKTHVMLDSYHIDFQRKVQISNINVKKERPIKRVVVAKSDGKYALTQSKTLVEWMWQSNSDPWTKSQPAEWAHYSNVENLIIEQAFTNKQTEAILDDYTIHFQQKVQILNKDFYRQRPVKRLPDQSDDKHIRAERFMPKPIVSKRPFAAPYREGSLFIMETRRQLGLRRDQLPSQDKTIVPMIVEKAALGIIEEGKKIGKQREAEMMAKELLEKKEMGMTEVWKSCAYLYLLECFLYKKLNEIMRLVGSEEQEHVWRSKISTLGPFSLLLWDSPINKEPKTDKVLYRGINLSDDLIALYQRPNEYHSMQSFTTCSRNRRKAEQFGNTLLIMNTKRAFTFDGSEFSEYPLDEEEVISPGVCFTVQQVEFDNTTKKHLFYLDLKHYFNGEQRFEGVATSIEWILAGANADYLVSIVQDFLKPYGVDHDFDKLISSARRNYINKKLKNQLDIEEIGSLFDRAANEKDPRHLLRAYTAETEFYRLLNMHLAQAQLTETESAKVEVNKYCAWIAGIIIHQPQLDQFSFKGECYRGMSVTKTDLKGYAKGSRILTKSFLSSSRDRNIANTFATKSVPEGKLGILCTYVVRNPRSALNLEEISMFPDEKEVLIMPYTAFKIMDVAYLDESATGIEVEIKLKECEPW